MPYCGALLRLLARLLGQLRGLGTRFHDEPCQRPRRVHAILDGALDIVLLPERRIAVICRTSACTRSLIGRGVAAGANSPN